MVTKNAVDIIKKHVNANPELNEAYQKEKRNYHIARKIREYRKDAQLTQKELARLIGTKQSVISRLERAEYQGHSLAVLKKIAEALNVPLENFLLPKNNNPRILTLHIPPIMRDAASFNHWTDQQIIRRHYSHAQ